MTRCVLCGKRIWPWQRIGWLIVTARQSWHPACMRKLLPERTTIADIQRILDEAQQ